MLASSSRIRPSPTLVIDRDETDSDAMYEQFVQYDGHEASFTNQMSGVFAAERDIECVVSFDPDHSRYLGFIAVSHGTNDG